MEKLYKYLGKLGIIETQRHQHRDIEYCRIQYGDDYFYNAPNYHYSAALVCFDYNCSGDEDYFRHLKDVERRIERYARRYGYEIFNKALHPWEVSFVIARQDDRENASHFFDYVRRSVNDVDMAIHQACKEHRNIGNDEVRAIMDAWGDSYNEFLKASA